LAPGRNTMVNTPGFGRLQHQRHGANGAAIGDVGTRQDHSPGTNGDVTSYLEGGDDFFSIDFWNQRVGQELAVVIVGLAEKPGAIGNTDEIAQKKALPAAVEQAQRRDIDKPADFDATGQHAEIINSTVIADCHGLGIVNAGFFADFHVAAKLLEAHACKL